MHSEPVDRERRLRRSNHTPDRDFARATALALSFFVSLSCAGEGLAEPSREFRIYEENDFFNPFTEQTDRYYTQGLRLEWLAHDRAQEATFLPGITHRQWCAILCGARSQTGQTSSGFAVGQNIYTPANIRISAPQPNDRPWAGLLYASRIAQVSYGVPALAAQRQDRIELSAGVVGPAALAKQTQIRWHKLIGVPRPEGWAHQLGNEPVLQARYDSALRWPPADGGNADLIARGRISVGNIVTSLEADITGRLGWNLAGFASPPIPSAPPPPISVAGADKAASSRQIRWLRSANFFLRAGGRAVARNIFLDGNSFSDRDLRINRKILVPEVGVGVEGNLVGSLWLTFQFIHRGSEFETRSGRDAPAQEFGALSLAWKLGD